MKWLLITAVLNSPMVYDDEVTCLKARNAISKLEQMAVCIPKGTNQSDESFKKFQGMLQSFANGMKETN